jgi:erythromycin esterase
MVCVKQVGFVCALLTSALLFAQSGPKPADTSEMASIRALIDARYAEMDADYNSGEIDRLAAIALPDAVIGPRKTPFSKAMEEIKAELRKGSKLSFHSRVNDIALQGSYAVVSVNSDVTVTSATGSRLRHVAASDTWVQTSGGWRLKESDLLSSRAAAPPTADETATNVIAGLKQYAVPLTTASPESPMQDLAPFGRAVGDARIVSLGEATHGTHEFFEMKHRIFRYLVERKGFTVFAIEANWPESLAVDLYIKTGEGDPENALAGMYFWTWNTEEMLNMIEWMRSWNQAPGKHSILTFTSFDMQTAHVATEHVLDYLKQASPEDLPMAQSAYQNVSGMERQVSSDKAKPLSEKADGIVKLFDARRDAMVKASSEAAWRDARHAAEIVYQFGIMLIPGNGRQSRAQTRDQMMAKNVEWLADKAYPGEKIVLWAHNAHVAFNQQPGQKPMGVFLRERFGRDMYVAGFAFDRGEVRAVGIDGNKPTELGIHKVLPSPPGSGDDILNRAGMAMSFLDITRVPAETPLSKWLAEPHLFHQAGSVWNDSNTESNYQVQTLSKEYDGLIYIAESHSAAGIRLTGR